MLSGKKIIHLEKNISLIFLVRVHNIRELVIVGTRRTLHHLCVKSFYSDAGTGNLFENEMIRWTGWGKRGIKTLSVIDIACTSLGVGHTISVHIHI